MGLGERWAEAVAGHYIPVELRGNSVIGRGQICVLQGSNNDGPEQLQEEKAEPVKLRINAVKLYPVLEMLMAGTRSMTRCSC